MNKLRLCYLLAVLLVLAGPLWQWQFPTVLHAKKEMLPPVLPAWPEALPEDVGKQILMHNLWRQTRGLESLAKASSGAKKSVGQPQWILVGTARAGNEKIAMIRVNDEVNVYYAGDVLPDGRKLLQILIDGVFVGGEGEEISAYVYLFGKKGS